MAQDQGLTRRGLLTGLVAGATATCGATATGAFEHKGRMFYGHGTGVQDFRRSALAPTRRPTLDPDFGRVQILSGVGNSALDDLVLQERNALNRAFNVSPDLFIFDDHGTPNAYAVPRSRTGRGQGTILLGKTLVVQEMEKTGYTTGSLKGVMAHEWTHIVQFQAGMRQIQKHRELHGDFMAGWYLRRVGNAGGSADFQTFANTLHAKGDYGVHSQVHHGTPAERVNAMLLGTQMGEQAFWPTFRYGDRLVKSRFA